MFIDSVLCVNELEQQLAACASVYKSVVCSRDIREGQSYSLKRVGKNRQEYRTGCYSSLQVAGSKHFKSFISIVVFKQFELFKPLCKCNMNKLHINMNKMYIYLCNQTCNLFSSKQHKNLIMYTRRHKIASASTWVCCYLLAS